MTSVGKDHFKSDYLRKKYPNGRPKPEEPEEYETIKIGVDIRSNVPDFFLDAIVLMNELTQVFAQELENNGFRLVEITINHQAFPPLLEKQ